MSVKSLVLTVDFLPDVLFCVLVVSVEPTDRSEELARFISAEGLICIQIGAIEDLLSGGGPLGFLHVTVRAPDLVAHHLLVVGLLEPVLLEKDVLSISERDAGWGQSRVVIEMVETRHTANQVETHLLGDDTGAPLTPRGGQASDLAVSRVLAASDSDELVGGSIQTEHSGVVGDLGAVHVAEGEFGLREAVVGDIGFPLIGLGLSGSKDTQSRGKQFHS